MIANYINSFTSVFRNNLRKLVPLALVYSWLELSQDIFLSPNSFLAETSNVTFYSQKWMHLLSRQLTELSKLVMMIMTGYFIYGILSDYLSSKEHEVSRLPWFVFFLIWILYTRSNNFNNYFAQTPFWLLLGLLGLVLIVIRLVIKHLTPNQKFILILLTTYLTYSLGNFLAAHLTSSPDLLVQTATLSLLGMGPTHLTMIFAWTSLAIFLQNFGFLVPFILQTPSLDLSTTTDNLNATLTEHVTTIPHLFTFYTLRDSFAMLGGLGMILPLLIAVLIESKKLNKSYHFKLSLICLVPVLCDQQLAFLLGLPIILEPVLLIPMILVSLGAEAIGALFLWLKWLHPAVYSVPVGTPNLLMGFLASNGDWRYFIVIGIILVVSVLIYLPFIKRAFQREALYD
ncbi:PTS sugar transporter subunit IIC [Streptococcus didelphis]|uniref:PTS sugar transporter subunit IIC n=1 Tax=Streptococcus didelphis TaxID=102886 RepID=UPI0003735188|nr:PTS sugar transporter subunit IIC [Streptococcus didelphis]WMB29712.1 PTS sugar transporter subunit IIC [Streptococcus didelphis]